ncbi:MAG: citryl-CoA lyase [Rhodospirillum sp.]|nr:citryl-CoA lyase [Rhodospirillum sp.]MCF8491074.1 citryl-CoA lyase [Rhodospirillum sp.]MCF8500218.1 citryl-CoA lyase [Rhodospirillum sp.]
MAPGQIRLRGTPIQDLIGHMGFAEMVWLMTRGDRPTAGQAALLESALVAAVDHGPQAPSVAVARMAVTCGLSLNGAMASAVNMLDDVHGGAGEQAVELYQAIVDAGGPPAAEGVVEEWLAVRGTHIPGFGHRFHKPEDPRAPRLLELTDRAREDRICQGDHAAAARAVQEVLNNRKGKPVPMNIDGATAVIYAELGFPAPLARGLFCLSRSVGFLAHGWEQMCQGGRNKGPTPPQYRWTYTGPNPINASEAKE